MANDSSTPQNFVSTAPAPQAGSSGSLLRGVVERITFHNEENGYTVAKMTPEDRRGHGTGTGGFGRSYEVTIVGNMAGINVGESVELRGRWTVHGEYGRQFLVDSMRTVLPATIAGIEKYLGSGMVKGVGPVTAKRIVKHFGLETLEVIDNEPDRLIEVPGVGRKRVDLIKAAWVEQRAIKEVMIFLQSNGVTTSLATKIYKYYGDDAIATVQNNPYRLAQDIYGIGFLTADKIARSLGIPADSPLRIAAGVAYALNEASDDGHVYLPTTELIAQTAELLDVKREQAAIGVIHLWGDDTVKVADAAGGEALLPGHFNAPAPVDEFGTPQLLAESGAIYAAATQQQVDELQQEERAVYLTPMYYSEMGVANRIKRIAQSYESGLHRFQQATFDWETNFAGLERAGGVQLAPQQREAVQTSLTHRITVLTGGPGTGKTTTVRSILELCQEAHASVILAAPTGRAAKRLAETTGREAKTIHRLLEFKPSEGMAFQRNDENPLQGDLLIVDEASMLDLSLTNHLLKAIPSGMHLLLVGDIDQLPSVGAGNVLKDIIEAIEDTEDATRNTQHGSLNAKVVRLETIFRQAAGSYIITNAHRINGGQMPLVDNRAAQDFFVFKTQEPERAAQLCVELVCERIPRRFAIPSEDVQVLSPMHRGVVGVGALNGSIQAALNPPSPNKAERAIGNRIYRTGDRVMQIRNNYDKDVYNGDMGTISAIDPEMQKLTVLVDGRAVPYDFLELDELTHAFAVSVHKSQGSEFPAVVIPVLTTHYMMLQRNLLYTAITRAKRLVVLVGQMRAIAIAVNNNQVTQRYSGLTERLVGEEVSVRFG